jgi:hypothetical protein
MMAKKKIESTIFCVPRGGGPGGASEESEMHNATNLPLAISLLLKRNEKRSHSASVPS